jgi:hypothetical protein
LVESSCFAGLIARFFKNKIGFKYAGVTQLVESSCFAGLIARFFKNKIGF